MVSLRDRICEERWAQVAYISRFLKIDAGFEGILRI
jgi:hypothetical protein